MNRLSVTRLILLWVMLLATMTWAQTQIQPSNTLKLPIHPVSGTTWSVNDSTTQILLTDPEKNSLIAIDPVTGKTLSTLPFVGIEQFQAESIRVYRRDAELSSQIAEINSHIAQLEQLKLDESSRADSAKKVIVRLQAEKTTLVQETPVLEKRIADNQASVKSQTELLAKTQDQISSAEASIAEFKNIIKEQTQIVDTAKKNSVKWKADGKIIATKKSLDSIKVVLKKSQEQIPLLNAQIAQAQKVVTETQPIYDTKRTRLPEIDPVVTSLQMIASASEQKLAKATDEGKPLPTQRSTCDSIRVKIKADLEQVVVVDHPRSIAVVKHEGKDYLFVASSGTKRICVMTLPGLKLVGYLGNGALQAPYVIAVGENSAWVLDNFGTTNASIKSIDLIWNENKISGSTPIAFASSNLKNADKITDIAYDPRHHRIYTSLIDKQYGRVDVYGIDGSFITSLGKDLFESPVTALSLWDNAQGGYLIALDEFNNIRVFDRVTFRPLATMLQTGIYAKVQEVIMCHNPIADYPWGLMIAVRDDGNLAVYNRAVLSQIFGMVVTPNRQ